MYISPFTFLQTVGLKRLKREEQYLLAKRGGLFPRGYHFNTKFSGGWIEHWDHRCWRQRNQPPSIPAPRIFSSESAPPQPLDSPPGAPTSWTYHLACPLPLPAASPLSPRQPINLNLHPLVAGTPIVRNDSCGGPAVGKLFLLSSQLNFRRSIEPVSSSLLQFSLSSPTLLPSYTLLLHHRHILASFILNKFVLFFAPWTVVVRILSYRRIVGVLRP